MLLVSNKPVIWVLASIQIDVLLRWMWKCKLWAQLGGKFEKVWDEDFEDGHLLSISCDVTAHDFKMMKQIKSMHHDHAQATSSSYASAMHTIFIDSYRLFPTITSSHESRIFRPRGSIDRFPKWCIFSCIVESIQNVITCCEEEWYSLCSRWQRRR